MLRLPAAAGAGAGAGGSMIRALYACAALALCAALPSAASDYRRVRVTAALDGDTVVVEGLDQRVRLASVDAPESGGRGRPEQAFGAAAQSWLEAELVGRAGVTMNCVDEDRHRRPVCEFRRGGESVNVKLVRAGLAWAYTAQPRYIRDPAVLVAQEQARQARRGLWAQPGAVAPWTWRIECWKENRCGQ